MAINSIHMSLPTYHVLRAQTYCPGLPPSFTLNDFLKDQAKLQTF